MFRWFCVAKFMSIRFNEMILLLFNSWVFFHLLRNCTSLFIMKELLLIDWPQESEFPVLIQFCFRSEPGWNEIFFLWDETESVFFDEMRQNQIFFQWDETEPGFIFMRWDRIRFYFHEMRQNWKFFHEMRWNRKQKQF